MTIFAKLMTTALVAGAVAAPAAAQYQPYPQPYPQTYPQGYYPQQQQQYGYQGGGIGQIIDQLLGNRYNGTDRSAVSRCASAVVAQAQAQYAPRGYNQGYNGYPGQGGYNGYNQQGYQNRGYGVRVSAITQVERRSNGLRVRGLLDTGRSRYNQGYNNGYQNQAYGTGDLTFRCNVDYRGAVTNVRIERNTGYRPY